MERPSDKEAIDEANRKEAIRREAFRRKAIRWWLGLVLIVAGVLGLLNDQGWGPNWSQSARWFWPSVIVAFGLAGMIGQGGFSLGLAIITVTGFFLGLPREPWVWLAWLVAIGLLIAFEQHLPERARPWKKRQPSGTQSPQEQTPVTES